MRFEPAISWLESSCRSQSLCRLDLDDLRIKLRARDFRSVGASSAILLGPIEAPIGRLDQVQWLALVKVAMHHGGSD